MSFLFLGCGPPPTAYNPKHLGGGNAVSFPKGERFRDQSSNELDIPNMQVLNSYIYPYWALI